MATKIFPTGPSGRTIPSALAITLPYLTKLIRIQFAILGVLLLFGAVPLTVIKGGGILIPAMIGAAGIVALLIAALLGRPFTQP